MLDFIDIDPTEIPCIFEIDFGDSTYWFSLNYNASNDFYSIDLYDRDLTPIILGEKITLDEPLWRDFTDERLPPDSIIPMDLSGTAKRVNEQNFYKTVFLYLDNAVLSDNPLEGESDDT